LQSMVGGSVIAVTNKNDWATKHAEAKDGKPVSSFAMVAAIEATQRFTRCFLEFLVAAQIIVDFTAVWCGPCRVIKPYFEELSNAYPGLIFLSVDVDACEVRRRY